MRYLITGISGFVGTHLVKHLYSKYNNIEIYGIGRNELDSSFLSRDLVNAIRFYKMPLLEKDHIEKILLNIQPDYILHLASSSSVAKSWHNPLDSFWNNTLIFLNLLEAVRNSKISCKILSVGSSEEYGVVTKDSLPIKEITPLNPSNPYAVARVAQEGLSKVYGSGYHIPIVCTRSFNHIGPYQKDTFVVSSFVKQGIEIKNGLRKKLICGDIAIIRDFIDVRDVVRAYDLLLKKGKVGEVYNVCSGIGYKLSDIINIIGELIGIDIEYERDKKLIRPVNNPVIIGSNEKILKDTGFRTNYNIYQSIADIIEYWSNVT